MLLGNQIKFGIYPMLVKTQRLCHSSRYSVGSLCGVIEAFRAYRSYIRQSALHLVRKRQGRQKFPAISLRVFTCGKNVAQVITGMVGEVISELMEKILLLQIVFMACTVTTRLPKVSAFFRCTVQLAATFALIIKDPTTVGVCTYLETSGIVISQYMGE